MRISASGPARGGNSRSVLQRGDAVSISSDADPIELFLLACGTIRAELLYLSGENLFGDKGERLPPILSTCLSRKHQADLANAVRIMEGLTRFPGQPFPQLSLRTIAFPENERWDLRSLETIFCDTLKAITDSPEAKLARAEVNREGDGSAESLLVLSTSCTVASRIMRLCDSLLTLAVECRALILRIAIADAPTTDYEA